MLKHHVSLKNRLSCIHYQVLHFVCAAEVCFVLLTFVVFVVSGVKALKEKADKLAAGNILHDTIAHLSGLSNAVVCMQIYRMYYITDPPSSSSSSSSAHRGGSAGERTSHSSGNGSGNGNSSSNGAAAAGGESSSGRAHTLEQESGSKKILLLSKRSHYEVRSLFPYLVAPSGSNATV